jgi:two-component system sensor histidine kinase PilS (NtrC family)
MATDFDERTWLTWLGKVRIIIITFLLGIELAVATLTSTDLPKGLFILVILLWYTIAVFYLLLPTLWGESRFQARLQVLTDLGLVTAVVYITGGIDSSFNFLFPLVIIVASILLSRAWAFLTAALAFILNGAMLELAYFEVIHSYSFGRLDLKSLQATILINLFAYLAIAYLSSQLSMKLRLVDVQLQERSGALENLQALHENIVNSISGGLITTGMEGRVRLINAAGERLLERSRHDLVGRPVETLFLDRLPEVSDAAVRCEVRAMAAAGGHKTFGMSRSVLKVPERGAVGYVYTFDDLTEIRRLEREVRLRDRLAAVGRMAAAIAHEIRNPLSSIAGSVKVLADLSAPNPDQRALVDIVTRESERLNSIVSDFLTYAREKKYQFALTDLVPLLDDTLTLLQNRPELVGDNGAPPRIRIERGFAVDHAPALVDGDRMKQVFWNICENALRAMAQGGVLTVSLQPSEGHWLISFTDTGHGVSEQEKEKLFEPFQSEFTGGTGLGLAIVYQIVQAHDGKITVRSEPGQGSEFTVHLKRSTEQPVTLEGAEQETAQAASAGKGARG